MTDGGALPRREPRRRWGAVLALAAAPDLLWAFYASIESLYYGWVVGFVPLLLLRFAITLLAIRVWFEGVRRRRWLSAWTLELLHSALLLALIASVYAGTFRYHGSLSDRATMGDVLLLGWPLLAAAGSVWALVTAPRTT